MRLRLPLGPEFGYLRDHQEDLTMAITVHGDSISGNCWKVTTILRLTGRDFAWVETDVRVAATRTPAFLAMNPNGKVPIAVLDDCHVITESNAILIHFAEGTNWLPPPGLARTRVMEWLFFEQYSHEPAIAVARFIIKYLGREAEEAVRLRQCRERGEAALDVMEHRLASHPFLTDAGPTVADIALVAYTQAADEGGFDLARWPGIQAWVARMLALPGIIPLKADPKRTGNHGHWDRGL
jgi:glutathione S-transferase